MSLINPTAANYLDRLGILELKIQHGTDADKPVEHFERERAAVLAKLATATVKLEHAVALTVVNARLWQAEDRIRAYRAEGIMSHNQGDIADLAFTVQELNDRRAELITAINVHAGAGSHKEKL